MPDCDLCGKPAVTQAVVEGARVAACARCASMGREVAPQGRGALSARGEVRHGRGGVVLAEVKPAVLKEFFVVPGAGSILRKAREKKGFATPEDLAHKIFINADYLRKIEAGGVNPDEKTATKLERELGVKIVVESPE